MQGRRQPNEETRRSVHRADSGERETVFTYYIGGVSGTGGRLGLYTAGVRGSSSQEIM